MSIRYNLEELKEIMWSFYTVSGIRFILFDAEYNKILAYPENESTFCTLLRKYEKTAQKCAECDKKSLRSCRDNNGVFLYKCHAGLAEAALALRENDEIVGYLMFGQVSDNKNSESLMRDLCNYCAENGIDSPEIKESIRAIRYMDGEHILAAAKVMEACTSYILLKELITPQNSRIIADAKEYIEAHLSEQFGICDICDRLNISRTKLYEVFSNETGIGVSEYIRKRRLHRAKKLLKTTDNPIWEIAQKSGFSDYTYFGRVYKRIYGISPREYRKHH